MAFTISGTGCSLGDFLFRNVNFSSDIFKKFLSQKDGDGGLAPGKLVFTEEFEHFCGIEYAKAIKILTEDHQPDTFNLGGPGIVALINTSQLLYNYDVKVNFYAAAGKDDIGDKILSIVKQTPVDYSHYYRFDHRSPFTDVLSDPNYDHGKGERIFINNVGCASDLKSLHLDENFFKSEVVVFGGTALVPSIHDNLTQLLKRSKLNNCITVVNTVYDFRNEKKNPNKKWPLGESDESYRFIDLLIMDMEEAMRLSGERDIEQMMDFFIQKGTGAFIITHGAKSIYAWSSGKFFQTSDIFQMPVSAQVGLELQANPSLKGDTTGCGDNFAGGVIASMVQQKMDCPDITPSLSEAIALGVASGGFACYHVGGTFVEKQKGQKYQEVERFYKLYKNQILKETI